LAYSLGLAGSGTGMVFTIIAVVMLALSAFEKAKS